MGEIMAEYWEIDRAELEKVVPADQIQIFKDAFHIGAITTTNALVECEKLHGHSATLDRMGKYYVQLAQLKRDLIITIIGEKPEDLPTDETGDFIESCFEEFIQNSPRLKNQRLTLYIKSCFLIGCYIGIGEYPAGPTLGLERTKKFRHELKEYARHYKIRRQGLRVVSNNTL